MFSPHTKVTVGGDGCANELHRGNHFTRHVITLYILKTYNFIYQLYLSKTGKTKTEDTKGKGGPCGRGCWHTAPSWFSLDHGPFGARGLGKS